MKKILFILFMFFNSLFAQEAEIIRDSINVLDRFMAIPEEEIPPKILSECEAIAIFPHTIKAGFIIGGRYGKGVLLLKNDEGVWSNPIFLKLIGGNIGWQIGAESVDLILVFKSYEKAKDILDGKFTLGADAAVAAGPLGRDAEASTDIKLKSEIYSYSKSKGLFIGISLDGTMLKVDNEAMRRFYKNENIDEILYKKYDGLIDLLKTKLYEYIR